MAIITPFLLELGKKGIEKFTEKGFESVSEDAISWFKSLFFKDDKPKKVLLELHEDPGNKEKLNIVKAIIENSLEDNLKYVNFLKAIIEKMPKIENTISYSKNVNTGNVNTRGGDFRIGDDYGN